MLGKFFDAEADVWIEERFRPHWSQSGAMVFVTFRTKDSILRAVLKGWDREKTRWLDLRGWLGEAAHWSDALPKLTESQPASFLKDFDRTREGFLDTCQGRCLLRQPALAQVVADSLLYFDRDRYRMGDFVIMPNHVHLLAAFPDPEAMRAQFSSWLHFTATKINRSIGEKGHFWQQEPFDHLVRSEAQYGYLQDYIAQNPSKAGLKPGEFLYRKAGD